MAEGHWRPRTIAAFGIRALVVGGPILLGTLTARAVSQLFDPHSTAWLVDAVSLGSAVAVSVLLARLGARLLPLAMLLRMTMLFPDRAPSRIKVARRATSKDELTRRLAHPDQDVREAATTLLALVTALGRHDRKTRGHSERVRLFCDLVGAELGLTEAERGRLRWVGLLHDIGKLEIAAEVLNKPGKLTSGEWERIRTHPDAGAKLAAPLADWLGPWFAGIRQHHERFDGGGYPKGLAGEHISLAGRAVAVVDAFETMTAARSYKSPMSTVAARAELARCAGSHFDPNVVRAFLTIALPRLLWTMGPLTFLVNFPFLRWIPSTSIRAADVAAASVNTAAGAVGVTAVTVVAATAHAPVIHHPYGHAVVRPAMTAAAAPQLGGSPNGGAQPGNGGMLSAQRGPGSVQLPAQSASPAAPDPGSDALGAGEDGKRLHGAPAAQPSAPPLAEPTSAASSDRSDAEPTDTPPSRTPPTPQPSRRPPAPPSTKPPAPPSKKPPAPPSTKPPTPTPPTTPPSTDGHGSTGGPGSSGQGSSGGSGSGHGSSGLLDLLTD